MIFSSWYISIKFGWSIAIFIHVCIVCGCFNAVMAELAELSGGSRDHRTAKPKMFTAWPFTGNVCQLLCWPVAVISDFHRH